MKIYSSNNLNFGMKFQTGKVLEVTTQKIFYSKGLAGPTEVIKSLNGSRPIGNRGYKYAAEQLGKKITSKYPDIKQATDEINDIFRFNPDYSIKIIKEKIKPILERFDKEIDVTL